MFAFRSTILLLFFTLSSPRFSGRAKAEYDYFMLIKTKGKISWLLNYLREEKSCLYTYQPIYHSSDFYFFHKLRISIVIICL